MLTRLVVDVGSAYLKAAYSHDGTEAILRLSRNDQFMPAVVNIAADGSSTVGLDGRENSAPDEAGLFNDWKRWFAPDEVTWIRGTRRTVEEMLGFLFGHVDQVWREKFSSAPDEVVVLHPSSWTDEQIAALGLAARSHWATVVPCSVAVAAARMYLVQTGVRSGSIVVVDMGAGLCDISRVTFADRSIVTVETPSQLPPLGGNDFDEALTSSILRDSEGAVRQGIDLSDASAMAHLRRQARQVKERLSFELVADLTLSEPGSTRRVTRAEFERCIEDQITEALTRAADELESPDTDTIRRDIILVGGSSRVPLVQAKVKSIFRGAIVAGLSPFETVLWGGLLASSPARSADHVVDVEQKTGPTLGRRRLPAILALSSLVGLAIIIGIATADGPVPNGAVGENSANTSARPVPLSPLTQAPVSSTPVEPSPTLPAARALSRDQAIVPLGAGLTTRLTIVGATGPSDPITLSTPGVGGAFNPILSADRRTVLYVNNRSAAIYVMAVDGSGRRQIFSPPRGCDTINHVSWHQTDDSILVVQCDVGNRGRLFRVNWRTSEVSLIPTPGNYVEDPTISPDGQTVVFWSGRGRDPNGGVLYIARIDGQGQPKKLSQFAGIDADPAWTPDGQFIAYRHTGVGGGSDIYIVSVSTLETDKPLTSRLDEEKPTWSPDGTKFLYVVSDPKIRGRESLYLYDVSTDRAKSVGVTSRNISTGVWSHR